MKKLKKLIHRFDFQINAFYFSAAVLIIALISIPIYYSVSQLLINESVVSTQNVLEMSSMNIETYIDKTKAEASVFAENLTLQAYLQNQTDDLSDIEHYIQSILNHDDYIRSVIIVAKDGRIISNEQDMGMTTSADMMEEDWYKNAIHNTMPILTGARMQSFSSDMNDIVISTSTEIKDAEGNNLGVLLIDMDYHVIAHYLQAVEMGDGGFVFIINQNGQLVYHKDPDYLKDLSKQKELQALLSKGSCFDEKNNLLIHQTKIDHTDWTLVGVLPMNTLSILKRQLMEHVIFIIIIIFLVVVLIGRTFLGRLSSPMKKLEKGMLEIEQLSEIQLPDRSYYEVEAFTNSYNLMIRKIKNLMRELTANEERLKEAEISALIAQINPHFLYNTLDTIIWMAEFRDYEKVISLTKSLAAFFRLSLANGKELVSLKDELEHVKQYLLIQQERYGEKLTFAIKVDKAIQDILIPKITLQPIVENSIDHGIKNSERSGHIEICAEYTDEEVNLLVKDDGIGFDPAILTAKTKGVGIHNVEQRIKLYYGENYGLTISSKPQAGCTVIIHIHRFLKMR